MNTLKLEQNGNSIASRLAECERVIEVGLDQFLAVGSALTDIRDARLYRETHETFGAYCEERWGLGRSRAYQLIDHARTVAAIEDAAGSCPPVVDISERDTRAIKADLPAVVDDIKARIDNGEKPEKAIADAVQAKRVEQASAKEARRAEAASRQAEREEMVAQLPSDVRDRLAAADKANAAAVEESPAPLPSPDHIAELEDAVEALEAEQRIDRARIADLSRFEAMEADYKAGGFDAVVAAERAAVEHWKAKYHTENREKVAAQKSAEFWRKRAFELGHSADVEATADVEIATRARAGRTVPGASA